MWTVHTLKWPDYRNRRRPDVRHCVCGSTYRWSTRLCLFIQLDVVVQFKSVKLIHHQSPPHTLVSLSTRTFLPILMFPLTFSVNSACMLVLAFIYILLAISHHSGPEWWNLCHWYTVWPHRKVAWVWYKKKVMLVTLAKKKRVILSIFFLQCEHVKTSTVATLC